MTTLNFVAFAEESLRRFAEISENAPAVVCRDCEEILAGGIASLRWLERAEEMIVEAENDCLIAYDEEVHTAIFQMYSHWLERAAAVRELIVRVTEIGCAPNFHTEFDECWTRAQQWLQRQHEIKAATLPHEQLEAYARSSRQ